MDAVLLGILFVAAFLFFPIMQCHTPATVVVLRDNSIIARYPLAENRSFTVEGSLGPMEIMIRNNAVSVISSCCLQKTCMHTGSINKTGRQIVCAPNHILIEITSPRKDTIDAITQ